MLCELHARYDRPLIISETGIEGDERSAWIAMIARECRRAMDRGVRLEGVCLYPILGHLGWDDDRYCPNGVIDWRPGDMRRSIDGNAAAALRQAQAEVPARNDP